MVAAATVEPRRRPRQRRSRDTVARILDAAARIFDESGYAGTTTNHVADEAGVSIGSLYQYFPNKDALLVGLAERHVADAADRLGGRLADLRRLAPDAGATVRDLVEVAVAANDSEQLHAVIFEECPRTPALRATLGQLLEVVVGEVAWHLERLGHGGADPARRAALVVAMVDAAVHEVVIRADEVDRAAAVDDLVGLVLAGIGAGQPARAAAAAAASPARRPKKVPSPSEMPEQ